MNKQQLIENLYSNRRSIGISDEGYNMHMDIGPYTLSVSVGDGLYSTPRQGGFEPDGYTAVEAAIIGDDGELMTVKQIQNKFGTDCAKMCEAWDLDGWEDMNTVMPYITWEQVVFVANMIDKHSPSAKDLV